MSPCTIHSTVNGNMPSSEQPDLLTNRIVPYTICVQVGTASGAACRREGRGTRTEKSRHRVWATLQDGNGQRGKVEGEGKSVGAGERGGVAKERRGLVTLSQLTVTESRSQKVEAQVDMSQMSVAHMPISAQMAQKAQPNACGSCRRKPSGGRGSLPPNDRCQARRTPRPTVPPSSSSK